MIRIKNLNKYYRNNSLDLHALKNVNIHIKKGEFIAIMGSSGSGKSTLMNILGCLDKEFDGEYKLDGIEIQNQKEKELSKVRNSKIGFVFQSFNLLSNLTALENVELPLVYAQKNMSERREKAMAVLERVGLQDRSDHRPNEVSGGQRQRIAVARALANNPSIILADEPTGNLDSVSERDVMNLFKELNDQGGTVIVVTHDDEVAKYCKRVIVFKDGELISDGERK